MNFQLVSFSSSGSVCLFCIGWLFPVVFRPVAILKLQSTDPFTVFSIKISEIAKFDSDLLKTNEDIGAPQSREILQTFVCAPLTPTIQTSVKFNDFAELTILLILRRSFQCCRQIFPNLLNSWKGLFRTDMQIKFNVDLYPKDYFVSNVIKFSFQVIKIACKRIKIFFRSIKFAFQRIKFFIGVY